ncbi:centrosomal protein 164 isoform X3 [Cotesia typhae]|uniref:centrosomal protein 164 isoform X3 n=1 Tax=Cotesia typhae TaxID=2053667 RepID=UPI003D680FAF
MSISQDSAATIVCREVFDEASHPSNEEIIDYAKRIGINPTMEPHLLDLAREGLMAPLPKGWTPCFHEIFESWYYYEASSGTTTWEHPLDGKYKELVKAARASQSRQQSLDDDSKTFAKDLESHEEAAIPKEPPLSKLPPTKIPTKLAPLRKSVSDMGKRKDHRRSTSEARLTDRSAKDYTNLQYQDPRFYESPKLLSPEGELNLREIVKRSESMSPRYEKDWEQLSSKFSSEENVIDIDKLSASSLTKNDGKGDRFDKEKHPSQIMSRQKELTLTGGGSMFLKSNRSRDNTPSHEAARFEDFQINSLSLERPKSILREKPPEDDDRHTEEERKSVRFDLEKDNLDDIKFIYSGSEDEDWDSEVSEPKSESKDDALDDKLGAKEPKTKSSSLGSKIVGNRFLVQEVSESEHLSQLKEDLDDLPTNKFTNIKNIDLFSKSDTDSTPRTAKDDSRSLETEAHLKKLRLDLEGVNKEKERNKRKDDDVKSAITRKHEREILGLKRELEERVEKTRKEMEASFLEQRSQMEKLMEGKLEEFKSQLLLKEQKEINNLVAEMDETRRKNLEKVRSELEACYEKERQEIFVKLKNELDEKKQEMLELRNHEIEKMENEYDKTMDEEKNLKMAEHDLAQKQNLKIEDMKKDLEKEFDDLRKKLRAEQREKMTKITEEHEKRLAEISRDYRVEENMARKVFKQKLDEIRSDLSREIDKETKKISDRATRQDSADYDKIRCEKRILEDKYKTLKDKYLKLKNDVRLAVEKRSKRKEGHTTVSETEKSGSTRTRTERTESLTQNRTSSKNVSSSSKPEVNQNQNQNTADNSESQQSFQRFSHGDSRSAKFESDDTTTASETMNSNILQKKKSHAKKTPTKLPLNNNNIADNPVENIRKQLEKLEDLVPVNTSSELEFFRHRIHVERDSVKRARETLRAQKNIFQGVQKAWKERSARATLEQLVQEERELSDMEVSLHRTKSLLGEKVIHLKHLEQSLERVANAKKNENDISPIKSDELTLSDISSASSGFSSTDLDKPDYYQESTEIIASLENLNSEIREIWNVLNKRRGNNVPPPPNLVGSDTRWFPFQHLTTQSNNIQGFGTPNIQSNILSQLTAHPPTTTQNIIAQYGPNSGFTTSVGTVDRGSNLIERTRNMRDWLRQARVETTDLISTGQATL